MRLMQTFGDLADLLAALPATARALPSLAVLLACGVAVLPWVLG